MDTLKKKTVLRREYVKLQVWTYFKLSKFSGSMLQISSTWAPLQPDKDKIKKQTSSA